MANGKPISDWKKRLIRQDLEMFMMGQITLKEITKNRKVDYSNVVSIQNQMIHDRIEEHKKLKHSEISNADNGVHNR